MALQQAIEAVQSAYLSMRSLTWTGLGTYTLTVGVTSLIYVWIIRPLLSPLRKVPGLSFNPIYGNLNKLLPGQSMDAHLKYIKEFGKIYRYYFFLGSERLLVADAEALKHIMVTNCKNYIKPPNKLEVMNRVIGDGLVLREGSRHAAHKRLMSPSFNQTSMRKMVKHFDKYANKLKDMWEEMIEYRAGREDWEILHIQEDVTKMTLDIIGMAGFGHEFNTLDESDNEVTSAFHRLLSGTEVNWRMAIPFYYSMRILPEVRKFHRDNDLMKSTIRNIIKLKWQKQATEKGVGEDGEDVLDMLMKARDKETGAMLDDLELEDEVMTLMAAGHETTSVALSWALLALSQNQEIQTLVRDEVRGIVPDDCEHITMDQINQMEYLDCVIKEILRLYPPITVTVRQTLEDDRLGPYLIPKGTVILLALGCMMRQPEYWEDPLSFKPERFRTKEGKSLYTFLPFLLGHRMCLGYRYALVQIKVVLATLVRKFHFNEIPNLVFKRKQLITMRPDPPLRLRVSLVTKPEMS